MSSSALLTEPQTSKHSESVHRRRLVIGLIVFLVGANVVLITGCIFMQEEIRSLRGTVEELKPLQGKISKIDRVGQKKNSSQQTKHDKLKRQNDFAHGDSSGVMTIVHFDP